MKINNLFKLVVAILGVELAGVIGSVFTVPAISSWYAGLARPALSPPNWIFAPVWMTLFFMMGVSLFLIWKSDPSVAPQERRRGRYLFFIQLCLNIFWSIIFFGLKSPAAAFIEIIFLWIFILWTILAFYKVSKAAAWLLFPYILWVSFAAYLNFMFWVLN